MTIFFVCKIIKLSFYCCKIPEFPQRKQRARDGERGREGQGMAHSQSSGHRIPLPFEVPHVGYCSCPHSRSKAVQLEMGFQCQHVLLRVGSPPKQVVGGGSSRVPPFPLGSGCFQGRGRWHQIMSGSHFAQEKGSPLAFVNLRFP